MCQMRQVFGAFLTDPIDIDETIFDLWLDGLNVNDTHTSLYKESRLPVAVDAFDRNLLYHDLVDHYRLYDKLEHYLMHPNLLKTQLLFQIPPIKQQYMIERYYSLNGQVARWFLGNQHNTKIQKDLDEISDYSNESLKR